MKKKIKDLTKEEVMTICEKYDCYKCPLYIGINIYKCKDERLNKYGDEEIEVEDDE